MIRSPCYWWSILACVSVLASCLVLALLIVEPAGGHGSAHPRFASMLGGGSASRQGGVLWVGWVYGAAQIVLYTLLMLIGLRSSAAGWRAVVAVGAAHLLSFFAMMAVYGADDAAPGEGFPAATLWMLLAVGTVPAILAAVYSIAFRRIIFSAEEEERFARILAQRAAS